MSGLVVTHGCCAHRGHLGALHMDAHRGHRGALQGCITHGCVAHGCTWWEHMEGRLSGAGSWKLGVYLKCLKLCLKLYLKLGMYLTYWRSKGQVAQGCRSQGHSVAQGCSAQLHVSQGMGF